MNEADVQLSSLMLQFKPFHWRLCPKLFLVNVQIFHSGRCYFGPVFGANSGTAWDGGACLDKGGNMLNTTCDLISHSCELLQSLTLPSPELLLSESSAVDMKRNVCAQKMWDGPGIWLHLLSCAGIIRERSRSASDGIIRPFPGVSSTVKGTKCRINPVGLLKWRFGAHFEKPVLSRTDAVRFDCFSNRFLDLVVLIRERIKRLCQGLTSYPLLSKRNKTDGTGLTKRSLFTDSNHLDTHDSYGFQNQSLNKNKRTSKNKQEKHEKQWLFWLEWVASCRCSCFYWMFQASRSQRPFPLLRGPAALVCEGVCLCLCPAVRSWR